MTDYHTLLSRAVAALEPNTRDAREALYNRARSVMFDQLRTATPPWPDAQIKNEAAALESAIRQVEFEARRATESARATPNQIAPRRRPIVAAADRDAAPAPSERAAPWSLSPMLIGVIGAVALAVVAAGSFAYLSRPGAKSSAPAVRSGGDAGGKPGVQPQSGAQKPAGAGKGKGEGKAADTGNSALPYELRRQLVYYRSTYPAGTIVVVKSQHMLYQVRAETVALRYSIGIGPKCLDAVGLHRIVRKESSAATTPVSGTEQRLDSRLGARVLDLSDIEYGIHGTDKPKSIGQNAAFGCFLLTDDDISDLYDRAPLDTRVVIIN